MFDSERIPSDYSCLFPLLIFDYEHMLVSFHYTHLTMSICSSFSLSNSKLSKNGWDTANFPAGYKINAKYTLFMTYQLANLHEFIDDPFLNDGACHLMRIFAAIFLIH